MTKSKPAKPITTDDGTTTEVVSEMNRTDAAPAVGIEPEVYVHSL